MTETAKAPVAPTPAAPLPKELLDALKRAENLEVNGASPRGPKAIMLDASDVQARPDLKDFHIRWVSTKNEDKATSRRAEGYVRLPESHGGRSIAGSMALYAIPRRAYEARLARQKAETKRRQEVNKAEHLALAESVARILKDKEGIDVDAERLIRE